MTPPEGVAALQTVLGIMEDNDVWLEPEPYYRLSMLLHEATQAPNNEATTAADVALDITIAEAALLLRGLSYTEVMSSELPWFEMVTATVRFVGDELLGLWTDDEWLAYRDAERSP